MGFEEVRYFESCGRDIWDGLTTWRQGESLKVNVNVGQNSEGQHMRERCSRFPICPPVGKSQK
jgi:hypothetical protein